MAADEDGRRAEGIGPVGQRVAANLRRLRDSRRMTTAQLSERLRALGRPILATGITKTEAEVRRVDVDDLVALAIALDTSPNRLLLTEEGGAEHGESVARRLATWSDGTELDLAPDVRVPILDAWRWAVGDWPLLWPRIEKPVTRADEERANAFRRENRPHDPREVDTRYFDKDELLRHPEVVRQAVLFVRTARQAGVPMSIVHDFVELAAMTAINGHAEPAMPVVAAIVTSAKGVLVTRRKDGRPLWGFVAGEVRKDPAERPEDAAVREVKEETGLEVRTSTIIGEREHPATGRHMIYIAAKPVRSTRVFVGDDAELAEVRWVSLAEADELMPDMFGPVRDYLSRTLKAGGP